MAKIPDTFDMNAPRSAQVRPTPVETGDLGLSRVAASLQSMAEGQQRTADLQAQTAVMGVRQSFDPAFKSAAATYDGLKPGFAQAQVDAWDNHAAEVRKTLSPDAQAVFDRANLQERLRVADQASGVEANASADLVKAAQRSAQISRVQKVTSQFAADTRTAVQNAFVSSDPTAPDWISGQLKAFDDRAAAAMQAALPQDRPHLELELANQRSDAVRALSTSTRKLLDGQVLDNTQKGLGALVNQVNADPTFLTEAMRRSVPLMQALPADVRQKLQNDLPGEFAAAALQGMQAREDWHGLDEALKDPRFKTVLPPETFRQFQSVTTHALTSEQRQLAGVTVDQRLAAELASIRETGQSTGFDPQSLVSVYGPVEGPAKVQQAQIAIADAQTVWHAVGDAAGLTPGDLNGRLDLLKPQAAATDYARKKALYDQAVETAQRLIAVRQTDPAAAIQADKASAALWRAAQDGSPATAQAWAADALARQSKIGIPDGSQRILPVSEAKRLVQSVAEKDASGKAGGLGDLYKYASRYGDNAGRVLFEVQRAGLPAEEASIVNAVDGDPVVLGRYARALALQKEVGKLNKTQVQQVSDQVDRTLKPLLDSLGSTTDGAAYGDAVHGAILRMAKAEMADGHNVQDAVKAATKGITDRYLFDASGFRLPAQFANQQAVGYGAGASIFGGGLTLKGSNKDHPLETQQTWSMKGLDLARGGLYRTTRDYVLDGGAKLQPRGPEANLTDAQKQARYAELIAQSGRWRTSEDDHRVQLFAPDPRGGLTPVLDKDGKPIVRSWEQVFDRVKRP